MARIDGDLSAIREELQAGVARLEDDLRRLATGDVALQYVGLGMVGLGLILQVAGSVSEALPWPTVARVPAVARDGR